MTRGWGPRAALLARGPGAPSPAVAFVVAALVHAVVVAALGVRAGGDTAAYSAAADRLIATGFDYPAVIAQQRSTYPAPLYVLFATVVAVLKLLFGARWAVALVALNALAAAGVAALLTGVVRRATNSTAAAWGALGLLLACLDVAIWTPFLLSDATFALVAFGVFALAADRLLHRDRGWAPVFALAVAAAFYRPPGVVLLPAAGWAFFLARSRPGAVRRRATAGLAGAAVLGTFMFAWILQQPSRWPLPALEGTLQSTARRYATGEIVSARQQTHHAPPVTVGDFAAVGGDRFLHFFAFTTSDFSLVHTLVNALFYLPVYALALWLVVALLRGRDGLAQPQRDVFLAAAAFVLATAAFHGLLQVDFDWRYRLPILPHLVLLAGGGIAVLLRGRRAAA